MSESGQLEINLKGGKALLVIAAFILFAGYKFVTMRQELETKGREVVTTHIRNEMIRGHLDDASKLMQKQAEEILELTDADILAIEAHGSAKDMVVKVELAPNPDFPPQAKLTRYYRMEYGSVMGYRVRHETDKWAYWLAAF